MKEISDDQANDCKQKSLQIELAFDISTTDRVYTSNPRWDALENAHDPCWDTLEEETPTQTQDSCDTLDTSNNLSCGNSTVFPLDGLRCAYNLGSAHQSCVGEQIFISNQHLPSAPQQYKSVGEQVLNATKTYISGNSVGEQVLDVTKKTAPQHDEATHWVEKYWVQRAGNKHWYHRYMWMCGRKIHRVYIGSVRSRIAIQKVEWVRDAIADGKSPTEIKQLIKGEYD